MDSIPSRMSFDYSGIQSSVLIRCPKVRSEVLSQGPCFNILGLAVQEDFVNTDPAVLLINNEREFAEIGLPIILTLHGTLARLTHNKILENR